MFKFKCVCQHHNATLTGTPDLIPDENGNGSWTVSVGNMMCPAYGETDRYGCWNTWIVSSN